MAPESRKGTISAGMAVRADTAERRPGVQLPPPPQTPFRDHQGAAATPSPASEEKRQFFRQMSAGRSPSTLRTMRISGTELHEDLAAQPPGAGLRGFLHRCKQGLEETFLLARLAFRLLGLLGLGWRWLVQLARLLLYAGLLLPGFVQMAAFYLLSPRVLRSIPYGKAPRNRLDLYTPAGHWGDPDVAVPVVIYVTGGAWTIGYKAWGSLLGRRLSKAGALVCCLDYRNFPQGTAVDMMGDVNRGIAWVLARIRHYGGDPSRVFLVGQSCGAQLAMMCLLTQAEQEQNPAARLPGGLPAWRPGAIRGVVGVSGVYNCHGLADHLHTRGLYRSLFDRIMSIEGATQLKLLSPTYVVKGASWAGQLPRVQLLHGDRDTCAPIQNAEQFAAALAEAGAAVQLTRYKGETHTSPLIENPMRGGRDALTDDILALVLGRPGIATRQRSLCPALLIRLAAAVCPF